MPGKPFMGLYTMFDKIRKNILRLGSTMQVYVCSHIAVRFRKVRFIPFEPYSAHMRGIYKIPEKPSIGRNSPLKVNLRKFGKPN